MKEILLNGYSLSQFLGYVFFFVIGYLLFSLDETSKRDRGSVTTPKRFSWKFWIRDNWRRYLTTILFTYVFFRFYENFTGHGLSNFEAIMVGLIGDGVAKTVKDRSKVLQANRTELLKSENPSNIVR